MEMSVCLQHLTTLTMDRKEGIINKQDAMRKLKLMDAKGKIWAQEVTMKIYDREILLVDNYTQVGSQSKFEIHAGCIYNVRMNSNRERKCDKW